jgi:FkbM family methyltransferase
MLVTERGDRMIVDTRDQMISPGLLCWGGWEPGTAMALDQHLKPGMRWIDIGANIGYFTVLGRKIVGPTGFTLAFEANPNTYSLLVDNMNLNWFWDGIKLEQKAVYHTSGMLDFVAPMKYAVNATLANKAVSSWKSAQDHVDLFSVESIRLDDYLSSDEHIDLIKIDIEGGELGAIQGAKRTLERLPNIKLMIEWSPNQMYEFGFKPLELISEIKSHGFKVSMLEGINKKISFEDLLKINQTTMLLLYRD